MAEGSCSMSFSATMPKSLAWDSFSAGMASASETLRKYTDFKRFVLDKAHRDINEKTSLNYEWEPLKTKNKVTALRFIFSKGKQNKITNKRTKELTDKFIQDQARPGETWDEARARLSNKNN